MYIYTLKNQRYSLFLRVFYKLYLGLLDYKFRNLILCKLFLYSATSYEQQINYL